MYILYLLFILYTAHTFIFGARNPNISSAGGLYEPVGGFLDISKLTNANVNIELRKMIKEGSYYNYVNGFPSFPAGDHPKMKIENSLHSALPYEKMEELGLKREEIKGIEYLAFTKKDMYQNYNLFLVANTNLESGQVLEKCKTHGDGELKKAIAVPVYELDKFIVENKEQITPTLKSILKTYLL